MLLLWFICQFSSAALVSFRIFYFFCSFHVQEIAKMFSRDSQVAHIQSYEQMKMGLKGFSWADTWALSGISTNTSSGGPTLWIKLDLLLRTCVLTFNNAKAVFVFNGIEESKVWESQSPGSPQRITAEPLSSGWASRKNATLFLVTKTVSRLLKGW